VDRPERGPPAEHSLTETLVATGVLSGGVVLVPVAPSYPLLTAGFAGGVLLRPVAGRVRTATQTAVVQKSSYTLYCWISIF